MALAATVLVTEVLARHYKETLQCLRSRPVLLVGGTGRTGRRVLEQLLSRGISVRVIVRSAQKLPAGAAKEPQPDGGRGQSAVSER